jgi:hypothetical protein
MTSENQVNETREQLRARLRNKINSKKNNRTNGITRKKGDNINESVKKIGEILANKNIESADQIDNSLIETIMSIISKEDLELLLQKVQENSKFKEILHQINEKVKLE